MGSLETPASTAWPLITAVGVTGLLAGLVTSPAVSAASGVLFVVAATGWLREVLPHEHHEPVPLAVPAPAVAPAERPVKHLAAGERGHRTRLPVAIYPYRAGLAGGAAGGVAMAALAVLHGVLAHGSVWYTINLLAAAGSAELASAPAEVLAQFSAEGFALALAIHTLLSLGVGLLYGALLPMFPYHPAWWGGVVAPLLWTALIAATLDVLNPALAERIAWPWFVASQVAFGVVAGLVVARFERVATFQHAALAERAGLESKGLEAGTIQEPRPAQRGEAERSSARDSASERDEPSRPAQRGEAERSSARDSASEWDEPSRPAQRGEAERSNREDE